LVAFPAPRRIALPDWTTRDGRRERGIALDVHEAGSGPAVILCHGFPELAYSWRHQVDALAKGGFRAIAPDQRGYGGSDAPAAIGAYDLEHLVADMVGLLDRLEIQKAVFAGHDWGGFVAWAMPIAHPERTAGVIGVNTPYIPFPTTDLLRAAFSDDERLYILWFQKPGVAEAVLDRDPRLVFAKLMRRGAKREGTLLRGGPDADANPFRRLAQMEPFGPVLLEPAELETYVRAFAKSGFRGGINWYRNIDRNKALYPEIGTQRLELPCLMVTAEWDAALPPESAAGMPAMCADLEIAAIRECGHWTQQEKPAELSRAMLDWLGRRLRA
jgi:pimeloyl-ACP methyl ester carboxylesterase